MTSKSQNDLIYQGPVRMGYRIDFFRKTGCEGITEIDEVGEWGKIFRISSKNNVRPFDTSRYDERWIRESYFRDNFITEKERGFLDFLKSKIEHYRIEDPFKINDLEINVKLHPRILEQIFQLSPFQQIEDIIKENPIATKSILESLELLSKIEYDFYEGLSFAFPNVCYFKEHKRLFRQDFKKQYKSFEVEDGGSITKEEKEFIESLSEEKVDDLFDFRGLILICC